MNKFKSIRRKLVFHTMLLIFISFVILLSVMTISNIRTFNINIEKSRRSIRNTLIAKGKTLAKNNSLAMSGMAADNAFTAIQNLVASTVASDEDLVYGIYMDKNNIPWVFADSENPEGIPKNNTPLSDSLSQWAAQLEHLSFKEHTIGSNTVISFAAPVVAEDETLGCIRYGVSTEAMIQSMLQAYTIASRQRLQMIAIIAITGVFSLIFGFFMVKQLAAKITDPIASLVHSSKLIADGNLDVSVGTASNDEIGDLATHFEAMRVTIRKYTDHLQDLIDEKMQQVNDILNNIDQGLFTINLDGTVNQEYSSRANSILQVDDVASSTINELLRLDANQESAFTTWLDLVKNRHTQQRWKKLARLAPVRELSLVNQSSADEMEYVAISYQRIYDKKGELSKIMILVMDETEKHLKDLQMAAERRKHESDVKAILSIANTPAEEIADYTNDTTNRLRILKKKIAVYLEEVNTQRNNHPDSDAYDISNDQIDSLYRHLHTIKGNSGSYGFELLSYIAHQAEDQLEKLRHPVMERRGLILEELQKLVAEADTALEELHDKIRLIFGEDEEITVRIPETRVNRIVETSKRLQQITADSETRQLLSECITLSWKPLKTLMRKYQNIAMKLARKQGKQLEFTINNDTMLYPGDTFSDLDETLIHIIRNSVDHGIEPPEQREEMEKGPGKITISFQIKNDTRWLTISDDGKGIDTELLVEKSISKGLITKEDAEGLSDEELHRLLFKGGVSTAETVSDVSGRGMGMHIVYNNITDQLRGTLKIKSTFGKGTTFTIILPALKGQSR